MVSTSELLSFLDLVTLESGGVLMPGMDRRIRLTPFQVLCMIRYLGVLFASPTSLQWTMKTHRYSGLQFFSTFYCWLLWLHPQCLVFP